MEKLFSPAIDVKRKRPINWEISFFVVFLVAFAAQFILAIAIFASKNSEIFSFDREGGEHQGCPDGMQLAQICANDVPHNTRKEEWSSENSWGRCVSEDICEDIKSCLTGGSYRRLSLDQTLPEMTFEDHMRRLASEPDEKNTPGSFSRANARRLMSGKEAVPESVWDFLEEFAYQPTVLFAAVFIAAALWLFFLQQATGVAVWGIIVLDVLMLLFVFFFYLIEFETVNWACPVFALGVIIAAAILYKKINCCVVIMRIAMDGLASNKRIFLVCFAVQLVWIAYFALWVSGVIGIHFVVTVGKSESEVIHYDAWSETGNTGYTDVRTYCQVQSGWPNTGGMYTFWILMYYWVTYFFRNVNMILLVGNLAGWYFNEEDYKSNWLVALRWCFGPCAGGNAFCSGIMGAANYFLSRGNNVCRMILSVLNPIDWIPLCLGICLKTIIITYTKYGLIAQAFSGLPFFQAAPKAFTLLKSKLGEALLTDYLGARVMSWATYVISIGIAFAAWAWADDEQGVRTFAEIDATLLIVIIFVYAYCLSMPFVSLVLVILLEQLLPGDMDWEIRARMNSIFSSVFIGSVSFFILTFVSQIVVNAMDITFFCFAVEEDNASPKQERFEKLYENIKEIVPGAAMAGGNNGQVVMGNAPGATGNAMPVGQQMLSVTVPPGTSPGTTLQIQTPQGQTIQVQVPAGVQQGQSFQVAVTAEPAPMPQAIGQPV